MRNKTSLILIGLMLGGVTSSIACAARTASLPDVSGTPASNQVRAIDESSASTEWKRYYLIDTPSLSLILPSEPEQTTHDSGAPEMTRIHVSNNKSGVYGVAYLNDLPAAARLSTESGNEFLFNMFIKPIAVSFQRIAQTNNGSLKPRMLEQRKAIVSGIEGLDQDFSLGAFTERARMLRGGQTGICVVAIWKQDTSSIDQTAAFFDSVKVVNRAETNVSTQ